jgi:hyaluronoglucosaminidase
MTDDTAVVPAAPAHEGAEVNTNMVELGIIEGFYGLPWSWEARRENVSFLAPHGYRFYLYAPKADAFLRRRWREPHPYEMIREMEGLSRHCAQAGVRFGVGLTPYALHEDFDDTAREALGRKLELFTEIGVRDLGVLFDDMRGDLPDLADRQARIVDWIAHRTTADRIIACPSYDTDDPILDRAFGRRPERYLERLGSLLDPEVAIFWTGEEVCSRELSPSHLERVADQLGRKPFIWDNYPVNDGQRMSQYLYIRAFTGRPAAIADLIEAHGINPALQPTLTRIPALTLAESYQLGARYAYGVAFQRAASTVLGTDLGALVREDLLILQDLGLDRLAEKEPLLRDRYSSIDHPAAREIINWLDGRYRITNEIVQTQ